ncbi:polysaccharide deacetylase family protein [Candidatus Woesearchaeota archaeon]|nr:polysaccharide deacetylase family protein [Candidatus Woesearchaeota archaeon]
MKQIFTMDVEQDVAAAVDCANLLRKHGLHGEFYICGYLVEKYPVKCRFIAKYHTVGGHGFHHENFALLSSARQKLLIGKTRAAFLRYGMMMAGWRFPCLDFTNASLRILAQMGIFDSSFNRSVWRRWGAFIFLRNWLSNLKRGQFFLPVPLPSHLVERPWDHVDLEDPCFFQKEGRLMMHCYAYPRYRTELEKWLENNHKK